MLTYQDLEKAKAQGELVAFLSRAIQQHIQGETYKIALIANEYDRQRNVTVNTWSRFVAEHAADDIYGANAANARISSNFFRRFNKQRAQFSLGNGVSFQNDAVKKRLGNDFDTDFARLAYLALIHGECFGFWNVDRLYVFPVTEFVPLYDEATGAMRAGIRWWRISDDKPIKGTLFEEGGMTQFKSRDGSKGYDFVLDGEATAYVVRGLRTEADGFIPTESANYSTLPVKRMQGSDLGQSTLIGLREMIDGYDLISSGFCNDLQDCSQIFWIIENCGGMTDADLRDFLRKLKNDHVATADTKGMGVEKSSLQPFTQDVPYQSRMAWLNHIRGAMYEAFGALDVTQLSAAQRTATEIEAAYEPMNQNADDFEYQCIDFIRQILELMGINDTPIFDRSYIRNEKEQVETVIMEANYLDDETILKKLPNVSIDEVDAIMANKFSETRERMTGGGEDETPEGDDE